MSNQKKLIDGELRTHMREYWIWSGMLNRCHRAKSKTMTALYKDKGIKVHKSWHGEKGFERFFAHVGKAPTAEHTIDRIDSTKGYVPGNVRWATYKENLRNRGGYNFTVTAFGETRCVSEWAERSGLKRTTIRQRIKLGWDAERAVTEKPNPLRQRRGKR